MQNINQTYPETRKRGFQPGNPGGPGRKPGSRNKKAGLQAVTAASLLERLQDLNREYWDMSAGQKLRYFEILLPFATPRLAATSIDQWSHRTDEELDKAVTGVVNKLIDAKKTIKLKANDKIEEAVPAGKD